MFFKLGIGLFVLQTIPIAPSYEEDAIPQPRVHENLKLLEPSSKRPKSLCHSMKKKKNIGKRYSLTKAISKIFFLENKICLPCNIGTLRRNLVNNAFHIREDRYNRICNMAYCIHRARFEGKDMTTSLK